MIDYKQKLQKRQEAWKENRNDIIIGEGVWLGTNAIILGPNRIGDNAVIASGAVVTPTPQYYLWRMTCQIN